MKQIINNPALCRVVIFIYIVLVGASANSQSYNLVPNSSYENYNICPKYLNAPPPWYLACYNSPAYCNSCCTDVYVSVPINVGGYQFARTGNAYVGGDYVNGPYRSYIQVKLLDSLRKGRYYYAEHYVNSFNSQKLACNNVAMLFTDTPVYSDPNRLTFNLIPANPQVVNAGNPVLGDTLNWLKVSGIFKAKGGEQYLTLGNFKDNAHTTIKQILPTGYTAASYNIDDVSVLPLDSFCLKADAGADVTIKNGDSAFIGSYTNGIDSIRWFNSSGQLIDSVRPGFYVKPATTGSYFYIVQQTVNGCFSRDTVFVNVTVPLRFTSFSISQSISSPIGGVRGGFETANEVNVSHFNIQRSSNGKNFETIGKVKANNNSSNAYNFTDELKPNTQYPTPLYYRLEAVDKDGKKTYSEIKTLNIHHSSLNVAVFPNPAKDYVTIESKEGIKEVKVFDVMGRQIASHTRNDVTNNLQLTTNNYAKGLYLVQVTTTKNEVWKQKLIVE